MSTRVQTAPVKSRNAGTRISVVVRVRPPNQREIASAQGNVIHVLDDRVLIFDPPGQRVQKTKFIQSSQARAKNLHFGFDKVLSPENTQEDVFEVVKNTIFSEEGGLLDGFNCTVFAYGATGSGKTFSMAGTPESPGLMSRAVQYIYTSLEAMGRKAKLKLSYLEIYNEQIRDLISPSEENSKKLKIVEDPEKGIVVTGLSHCYPTNTDEVLQLISIGNSRRTQAQTESNPVSSRSHAVCQIEVENCDETPDIESNHAIGKLSLIDLAGSERATSNTGIRLKESAKINCSLLALSNCINALCTQNSFIPFRQSKLTRLLKDSLGGNCKTVCLSCVSPSYMTYDDTYSTLQYANKTKNIRTNVTKNTLNITAQVSQYPKIIAELKARIQFLENQGAGNSTADSFARSIEEPFNRERQSILSIFNREMQNIVGTDTKQQMMALQKMANSDIKRKVTLKISAFTTDCIRKRPTQSNKAVDNEQKIKTLELENIALKGQLELAEKQIAIQQNVIRTLSQKQSQQQLLSQRQLQALPNQTQVQSQMYMPNQKQPSILMQLSQPQSQPPMHQQTQSLISQQQQLVQQQQSTLNTMPLLDLSQISAPPKTSNKADEIIDLIDLTTDNKENRPENVDPNKNTSIFSFFDEPETGSLKSSNNRNNVSQNKDFYSQSFQQKIQQPISYQPSPSSHLSSSIMSTPQSTSSIIPNPQPASSALAIPHSAASIIPSPPQSFSSIMPNQQSSILYQQVNQQKAIAFQQQNMEKQSQSAIQQPPPSYQRNQTNFAPLPPQPLSARRALENRISITDMSRIKNIYLNNNNNANNENVNNNNISNATNETNNNNITGCTSNNNNSNIATNNFANSYNDVNNNNQPVSKIARHDDPGRLFRQKFAEAEKMESARKPLSEKAGNGTVSSGISKFGGSYKSLMDQLSERVAANGMNDETTSILLRSRMLTQVGKR